VPFAIRSRDTNKLVGSTRFHEITLEHLRAEIGWTLVDRERPSNSHQRRP
jgi:RimJ/RimL family protein N-acetyltransferase